MSPLYRNHTHHTTHIPRPGMSNFHKGPCGCRFLLKEEIKHCIIQHQLVVSKSATLATTVYVYNPTPAVLSNPTFSHTLWVNFALCIPVWLYRYCKHSLLPLLDIRSIPFVAVCVLLWSSHRKCNLFVTTFAPIATVWGKKMHRIFCTLFGVGSVLMITGRNVWAALSFYGKLIVPYMQQEVKSCLVQVSHVTSGNYTARSDIRFTPWMPTAQVWSPFRLQSGLERGSTTRLNKKKMTVCHCCSCAVWTASELNDSKIHNVSRILSSEASSKRKITMDHFHFLFMCFVYMWQFPVRLIPTNIIVTKPIQPGDFYLQ